MYCQTNVALSLWKRYYFFNRKKNFVRISGKMRKRNKRVIFCTPFIFINIHWPCTHILLFVFHAIFFRCQCVLIYRYFFNDNSAKTYTSRTAVFNRSVLFYVNDKILVTRSSIKVFFIYITKFKQVEYCLNKFWKSK